VTDPPGLSKREAPKRGTIQIRPG
ncbi:MAG: hypothetical protein RL480_2490, partial [Pseudomonadota bacterium]